MKQARATKSTHITLPATDMVVPASQADGETLSLLIQQNAGQEMLALEYVKAAFRSTVSAI